MALSGVKADLNPVRDLDGCSDTLHDVAGGAANPQVVVPFDIDLGRELAVVGI